ncbi:MAG: LPS export ABC transporter permease LptG [Roseiarcus sp.]|jgi:lipopolysaccharide export system permease protein
MIGGTLGRYFARRFLTTIVAVFMGVFALVFALNLVEMLRRSSATPAATGLLMAWDSFLFTPIIAEQALPFAVLFGAMISFLNLSRKLELVVARAAGVSAWQFIAPPLLVAVAVGVFAVTIFNPASTAMKRESDRLEAKVFGADASASGGVWIRQKSVDGEAVFHADGRDDSVPALVHVQVFNFDASGDFIERVDAESATLHNGFWSLKDVNVVTPGFDTLTTGSYLLATSLSRQEVAQAFVAPETVSFWALPALAAQTDRAGLDATGYRLQFQELLALPLTLAAMVLVAACFSLRFFRMGGVQKMVSGGVAAGFVLYVVTKLVNDLGGAGFVSVPVAGWSTAVVGCSFGVYVLMHQEDG